MSFSVGVIGSGAWGTALGHLLASKGAEVQAWAYETEVVEAINHHHENTVFLPGFTLPPNYSATASLEEAVHKKDLIVTVMPSHVVRPLMKTLGPMLPSGVPIVSATKGIENESLMLISEVLEDVLPEHLHGQLAYLSGPSFAKEVAAQLPTAVSIAATTEPHAEKVQAMMASSYFRTYSTTDVIGVEVGGALKNVMAIAAGACDGLGFGYNTATALITRGLAEMNRLAMDLGAKPLTIAGLSGMGDLVLTCMGGLSRNRAVGQKLGQGQTTQEITGGMKTVAEGIRTARSAKDLADKRNVDMPIVQQVYAMLYEDRPAKEAVSALMARSLKPE